MNEGAKKTNKFELVFNSKDNKSKDFTKSFKKAINFASNQRADSENC